MKYVQSFSVAKGYSPGGKTLPEPCPRAMEEGHAPHFSFLCPSFLSNVPGAEKLYKKTLAKVTGQSRARGTGSLKELKFPTPYPIPTGSSVTQNISTEAAA